ncbi:DoxX family membrane protein [Planctomycetota bacterium]
MRFFQHVFVLLARVLLSLFFVWNGAHIILDWQTHRETLVNQDVRFAVVLLTVEVILLLVGGLLLMTGFRGRVGALLLIVFLAPDTFVHTDWSWLSTFSLSELVAHAEDVRRLTMNLGLLGGLLLVLGFGSGGFSVDLFLSGRKDRKKKKLDD